LCFFFQAEDGIRDFHVTGVQTCALPISKHSLFSAGIDVFLWNQYVQQFWIQYSINKLVVALKKFQLSDRSTLQERVTTALRQARSEERRVGKKGRLWSLAKMEKGDREL